MVIAFLKQLVSKELGSSILLIGVGKIISDRMLMKILDGLMFWMFFIDMVGLKYRNKTSIIRKGS